MGDNKYFHAIHKRAIRMNEQGEPAYNSETISLDEDFKDYAIGPGKQSVLKYFLN
jgi:hypothetical protein